MEITEHEFAADRSAIVTARFDARVRATIRPLISAAVIAEHERNPLGDHSDDLKRVLNYLRRSSAVTSLSLVCTKPYSEWRLVRLSGERGKGPTSLEGPAYNSEKAAMHAVFLKRIAEIMRD